MFTSRFIQILMIISCSLLMSSNQSFACSSGLEPWVKVDDSLMMALRSNSCHYWAWAKANALGSLGESLIKDQAAITGDPHHENFSYVFSKGQRTYVLNDLDDVGLGPVFLDFLKFLTVSRSVEKREGRLNTEKMLNYYLLGLRGKAWNRRLPKWLRADAGVSVVDFEKDYSSKIAKRIKNGLFKKDDGLIRWKKIESARKKIFKNLEAKLFRESLPQGFEILDRAIYVKLDGGGSLGVIRYLYYLKKGAQEHIIEFKPLSEASLAVYMPQHLGAAANAKRAMEVYWPKHHNDSFKIVESEGEAFFMRPKLPKYVDFSLKNFEKGTKKFAELSYFIAHYMGLQHGKQLVQPVLIHELESDMQTVVKKTQDYINSYLKLAREEHN